MNTNTKVYKLFYYITFLLSLSYNTYAHIYIYTFEKYFITVISVGAK